MHKNILFIFKEHIVGDHLDAKYSTREIFKWFILNIIYIDFEKI